MRNSILYSLFFFCTIFSIGAQEVKLFTNKKVGDKITLGFKVVGKEDRTVLVDYGYGTKKSVIVVTGNKYTIITDIIEANTIKIYSNLIKSVLCNNQEITKIEIDESLSKTLSQIECSNNLLTTLKLDEFQKLSFLKANNNKLREFSVNELAPMKAMFDISNNLLSNSVIDKIIQKENLKFEPQSALNIVNKKEENTSEKLSKNSTLIVSEIKQTEKRIINTDSSNLVAVRQGVPGISPFWNEKAVQFLYPPAFDVKPYPEATSYGFSIISDQNHTVYFVAKKPYESLLKVWSNLPVGKYTLKINALGKNGNLLSCIYVRTFHRAAEFQEDYKKNIITMDKSVEMGLNALVHSPELSCWFSKVGIPDSSFIMYRYPSKMVGSAASALAIYASQIPVPSDAGAALQASKNAADYLLKLSFSKGDKWEFHPRTYHPTMYQKILARHKMNSDQYMTSYGGEVAQYYLDVFDATKDKKYLNAAINIGNTYLKNQLPNGTWPLMVYGNSGELVTENLLVPTIVITYLQRIYSITGNMLFLEAAENALKWVTENPVKTWNWQGQYEDVRPMPPYQNLTEHEACDFAIYLLQNFPKDKQKINLATDLIRFSEDQFVVWANPPTDSPTVQNPDGKQAKSSKWITPCVLEQYRCYAPVSASSAKMIRAYIALYQLTNDKTCLEKANALASSMINLQQTPKAGGRFLTWIQQNPGQKWLNCELTTIKALNELIKANKK